jgi:aspartyl protease family protein
MNKPTVFIFLFLLLLVHDSSGVERVVVFGLFKDKAVFEIDGKPYTLTTGETSSDGVTLVSANSKEAVLEINGTRNTYTLGVHIGSSFDGPAPGKTVTIAPDSQGMFMVNGSINGHQVTLMVDTGATLITMNRQAAGRFGIDYKLTGKQAVSSTASGYQTLYIINLKSVNVGGIQLENVAAAVHDGDFPEVVLLGNSFLNNVSIKREGQLLQLIK